MRHLVIRMDLCDTQTNPFSQIAFLENFEQGTLLL
jgi:hypothetical protein